MTTTTPAGQPGIIYLLHFSRRYKHAGHYIGWVAADLDARLAQHRRGSGARLLAVAQDAGIT
jgi:predicted GIY-YIG superfamily endonuclease